MLDDFENPAESQRKIKDISIRGSLTHEIIQKLNKTFVTPLDREDIYSLPPSSMTSLPDRASAQR
jgi:uncharacterized protein Yka (UPF0111/DUF47 family)